MNDYQEFEVQWGDDFYQVKATSPGADVDDVLEEPVIDSIEKNGPHGTEVKLEQLPQELQDKINVAMEEAFYG